MKYSDLRKTVKTGDVLMFSGKGAFSEGIKLFTGSKWSHVGMIYKVDEGDLVFCWESTTLSGVKDAETKKVTQGVQLSVLSERLEKALASGYELGVRKLNQPISLQMLVGLRKFREEVKGRPYEKKKLQLIKAAYDAWLGQNKEDLSSLFCSELVAEAYQRMGLLDERKPSNEYTPKDFSSERRLALLGGYSLSKELPITAM